jgi:hypothetical protein
MNLLLELSVRALVMGIAAAALMDAWGFLLRRGFGVPTLDYALLGRWIGHLPKGRLFHERIASAEPIPGERPLGWLAHYAIGVAFAAVLLAVAGLDWARAPSIWPAMAIGLGTIVAPWFLMQPGMGAGIAGSRTADPTTTRLRNLATHAVYGAGLYATAVALAHVMS